MPKILYEADNFSSFTWKDLPEEALAFVHEHFIKEKMTLEEYTKTYFDNKIPDFKHEADRLFEEGKKKALAEGAFPKSLSEIWTSQVIKKSENISVQNIVSVSPKKLKDKNASQRAKLNQKISQNEEELEGLTRMSYSVEENNAQVIRGMNNLMSDTEALLDSNTKQGAKEHSLLLEVQHALFSGINRQNETFEDIGQKTKRKKEENLDKLQRERNKLEW